MAQSFLGDHAGGGQTQGEDLPHLPLQEMMLVGETLMTTIAVFYVCFQPLPNYDSSSKNKFLNTILRRIIK